MLGAPAGKRLAPVTADPVPNKARKGMVAALEEIEEIMSFPLLGIDSDSAHVEQMDWAVVRTVVGYHRYPRYHRYHRYHHPAELLTINKGTAPTTKAGAAGTAGPGDPLKKARPICHQGC